MDKKIIVAGIGPGDEKYITPAALEKIRNAKFLVGGRRALETFATSAQVTCPVTKDIDAVLNFIREKISIGQVVVMVSGDPGYYSMLDVLRKNFDAALIEVIPSISSIQLAFAKTWQSTVANVRSSQNAIDNKADLSVKVVETENGYKGEVFLPFTMVPSWKTTIENGQQIDMAIVVADSGRKDEGLPRLQAGNVPHFVENFKTKTQSMPQYFFDK